VLYQLWIQTIAMARHNHIRWKACQRSDRYIRRMEPEL
jgi:hypothetical protein